ncbi:MAG TPA: ABC transporter permease [Conexibacter sp.]|jgi:putative ABC transport system permease protein
MRFSGLLHLYRVRLRSRLVQEALATIGIAAGVALVFAALIANASLTGSVQQLTSGIIGDARLQLISRGPAGIDERVVDTVARLDGVHAAAPIIEQRANVVGPTGRASVTLVGGDPGFAHLGGALVHNFTGASLARQRAFAIPAPMASRLGLGLYRQATIETGIGTSTLLLGAILQRDQIGPLVHSPVAIMPILAAQQITGMGGRVSRVYIQPAPGRDAAVRRELQPIAEAAGANVRSADSDIAVFNQAAYPTQQSTQMFAVLAAAVGFLFAACAVLLTVGQRRALATSLRTEGYVTRSIVWVLVFDALVLGTAGVALGLLLGDELSRHVFSGVPDYLATGFPLGDQRIVSASSIAIATAGGLVVACAAVLIPLVDIIAGPAARIPTELVPRWQHPAVAGAGAACLAFAGVIALVAPSWALVGLIALVLGLLLLLPVLVRAAGAALSVVVDRLRSPGAALASWQLKSAPGALLAIALTATGALAVFAAVAIGGARGDLVRGLNGSGADVDRNADVWVTFRGGTSAFAVTPFNVTRRQLAGLRSTDGIAGVGLYRGSWLDLGNRRTWVQAPPAGAPAPVPPSQLRAGGLAAATSGLRAGGAVVLSEAVADQQHVGVGDTITLPTPRPTRMRVAGISTNLGWASGAIIMNAADYARAWDDAKPSAMQLRLRPGASPTAVAAAVRASLGEASALDVQTQAQRLALHRDATRQGLIRLSQITVLVLISAMLAMAVAMIGVIWQRRASIARLKVDGIGTGELWRSLLIESTVLLGSGALAGAATGLLGQLLLSRALEAITGFPVVYVTALPIAVGILGLVTVVAVAIIALPGWAATRVAPAAPTAS